jgi:hypothetical protein
VLAIDSGAAQYTRIENQLASITTRRDALALKMEAVLEAAEFNGQDVRHGESDGLAQQGEALPREVRRLARPDD